MENHSPLTFVHISDTHIYEDDHAVFELCPDPPNLQARRLVEQIMQLPFEIDFVLHTGDVVWDPTVANYEKAKEILSELTVPIHYIVGNHDHPQMLQSQLLNISNVDTDAFFYYEQMIKGIHLIGLDGNREDDEASAALPDEQLQWLEQTCAKDEAPLIIAIHHHPFPEPTGSPILDGKMNLTNSSALHNILKQFAPRIRGVFHGHIHQSTTVTIDGITYHGCAASSFHLKGDPSVKGIEVDPQGVPEFSVVRIQDGQTFNRRYPFQT